MDGDRIERWTVTPVVGDRNLHRRVFGDPSVPGWQWTAVTDPHDASVATQWLHLCAVQLARGRHREYKGAVLPRPRSHARNDSQPEAEVAAVGRLFSERAAEPETTVRDED